MVPAQAAEIVLAALIALMAAFNDGLSCLDKKDYDKAVTKFTEVIDSKAPGNSVRELALYYRAAAYSESNQKPKALADLTVLLPVVRDPALRGQAVALYGKLGGDWKAFAPKETPRDMVNRLIAAVNDGKEPEAMACFGGDMSAFFAIMRRIFAAAEGGNGGNVWHEMLKEMTQDMVVVEDKVGVSPKDFGRASLSLRGDDNITLVFALEAREGKWQIMRLESAINLNQPQVMANGDGVQLDIEAMQQQVAGAPGFRGRGAESLAMLRQLAMAIKMYQGDNSDAYPPTLQALIENKYASAELTQWPGAMPDKPRAFLYCPTLAAANAADAQLLVAAAPEPVGGKRDVAFNDGHVQTLAEAEFQKLAAAQKWTVPGALKKEDVPAERRKEIEALIAQLSDPEAKVRKDARKKLADMGPEAAPVLEASRNSPDPEVRMIVKELLGR